MENKNPALKLYEYWTIIRNMEFPPERQEQAKARYDERTANTGHMFEARYREASWPTWKHFLGSNLHLWVGGYEDHLPVFVLGISRGHRGNEPYFVLYPDGRFLLPNTYGPFLRRVSKHTFLGYEKRRGQDMIWLSEHHSSYNNWVDHRNWQKRTKYWFINGWGVISPLMLIEQGGDFGPDGQWKSGWWEIAPSAVITEIAGSNCIYTSEASEHLRKAIQAQNAWVEKRYRFYQRRDARDRGLPDPFKPVSPRREKTLAAIVQMIEPYTPAKSNLLRQPTTRQPLLQAQEG